MTPTLQIGPYEVSTELGQGSLGQRFRSIHDGRPAVLEVVSLRGEEELFERAFWIFDTNNVAAMLLDDLSNFILSRFGKILRTNSCFIRNL